MCRMIPDEKKPVPWGLPPLRSEVLAAQEEEEHHTQIEDEHHTQAEDEHHTPLDLAAEAPDDCGESAPFISEKSAKAPAHEGVPGLRARLSVLAVGLVSIVCALIYIRFWLFDPEGINPDSFSATTLGTSVDTLDAVTRLLTDVAADSNNTVAWDRLAEMTDMFGHRMTASDAYDASARWVVERVGAEDAQLQATTEPVWVDSWTRGHESLRLYVPTRRHGFIDIPLLGLGNSVPTPPEGVDARIIPVRSFAELDRLGDSVRGSIVLFDYAYDGYASAVAYRSRGALAAQTHGARAVLVRSATPDSEFHSVHTGSSRRAEIPAAAISPSDASMITRMYARAQKGASRDHVFPHAKLVMNAKLRENARQSPNILIDVPGREIPDEIVLISGHFDSWDVGVGAMDDGAGAFAAWEAARMITMLGRNPRRTVRVVMWNNEETRQRGSNAYYAAHKHEIGKHVFAVESDIGVFEPWGLVLDTPKRLYKNLRNYGKDLLKVLGAGNVTVSEFESPGEDIEVLCKHGVPCAGFVCLNPENGAAPLEKGWEDYYFRYHHTQHDRVELIDKHQLRRSSAALAAWAYLVADIE